MDIKVSVIVPVHNVVSYIEEALDSLLEQDFKEFEALCIDSSTDGTTSILKKYENRDKRFRLIEDSNSSYGYKMNRGIKEAKGKYIAILESDDLMKPNMLSTLYDVVNRDELDFAKCSFTNFICDEKRRFEVDQKRFFGMSQVRDIIDLTTSNEERQCFLNNIWSGMYKKSFLVENGIIFNESSGASYQDTGFSFLCIMYGKRVKAINDCLYLYRRDREESSVKDMTKYRCIYDELKWISGQLKKHSLDNDRNRCFLRQTRQTCFLWNLLRLGEEGREKFLDLIEDREDFEKLLEERLQKAKLSDDQFCMLKGILLANDDVAVFGAGRIANAIFQLQEYLGTCVIRCVMDNDSGKWGSRINNVSVVSPDKAVKDIGNSYVIVGVFNAYEEIRTQLSGLGVPKDRIIDASMFPLEADFINRINYYLR